MLKGKKRPGNRPALPLARTGPVRLAHALPGRVRFRIPGFTERPTDATELKSRLTDLDGVDRVTIDPVSGSVLIEYDWNQVDAMLLFAAVVRLIGAESELENMPLPYVQREFQDICRAMNHAVYDRTWGLVDLKSAVLLTFIILGLRKILKNPQTAFPAGLSAVWLATNGLMKSSER